MFECLHRALEDKTVSSVNADIEAESCSLGQDHLSSSTKSPNHYYIAEDSLLISDSFTNKFKVLFCLAISKCFFLFHFAFSLLPPPSAHLAWQWIYSMAYKIKLCRSLRVALGFQFDVDKVSLNKSFYKKVVPSAICSSPSE